MQDYGDQDHNIVSLYGAYGNNEKLPPVGQRKPTTTRE